MLERPALPTFSREPGSYERSEPSTAAPGAIVMALQRARPHRSLDLMPPHPATVARTPGTIRRRDVLGRLIHEYELAA